MSADLMNYLDKAVLGNEQAEKELRLLRGLLLMALFYHQGAKSNVGQPIRKALGIGIYDAMTQEQIQEDHRASALMQNIVMIEGP